MKTFRVQPRVLHRMDEIYDFTRGAWGVAQAERYIRGLTSRFQAIAAREFPWRPVSAELGVDGYVCRYEAHMIYWRTDADGGVIIVSLLHAHMHQMARLRDDFDV
jgi:toxin ParE1/3/4